MAEPVTYSGYLRLDQLLSAQQPRSSEHDEMLFTVIRCHHARHAHAAADAGHHEDDGGPVRRG